MPSAMSASSPAHAGMSGRLIGWLSLAGVIALLDQLSKWVVLHTMSMGEVIPVTSFFKLVLVYNPGAAFSFLADHGGWQRWFFTALAVLVSGWLIAMLRHHQHERALPTAFSLIIGGAIGNVIDRIVHGAVVDFLYFHYHQYGWPAFNLADSAITCGVILMLWSQFRPSSSPPTSETSP